MNSSLTIVLALLGYGYMSMAWGSVVGILTNVLISMYFLPSQYRKYPTIKEWRKITNFSLYNTLVLIMRELGKEGSNLLIGKLTNLESLGLYSRAYGYMDIFRRIAVDAILPVIHSKLSIDNRSGISLSEPYIKIFEIVIGVGIPGYLFLSIMSEPLIMVLYGNQWISAASVASILCITGILTLITLVNAQMLLAVGEVKKLAIVNVIIQPIKLVVILMVAANGLVSVAVGLLISEIIHVIYSQKYVIKSINLNIQAWRKGFFKCLVLGGLTAIGPLSVRIYVSSTHLILILIIAITTSIIGWLAGMWLTGHPLKYEIISMASTIKGRIIHQN
jgi:O-antigen/teichoic acid export membrane protein